MWENVVKQLYSNLKKKERKRKTGWPVGTYIMLREVLIYAIGFGFASFLSFRRPRSWANKYCICWKQLHVTSGCYHHLQCYRVNKNINFC